MTMSEGDLEEFWFFRQNNPAGLQKCEQLFNTLKQIPYLSRTY